MADNVKQEYRYHGGVRRFDTLVATNWAARTFAATEQKAIANLIYQYKKRAGLSASTKVTLTGKPTLVTM